MDETDDKDFNAIIDSLLISLGLLRTSSNIVYKKEEAIVKKFYNIIYKAMMLEILYTGKTRLYDEIKKDETDTHYIVNELKEDVKNLNNPKINRIVEDIQCNGIDDGLLLDDSLLFVIAAIKNPEVIESQHEEYELSKEAMKQLEEDIESQTRALATEREKAEELDEKIAEMKKERRRKRFKTVINSILLAAGITGVVAGAEKLSTGEDFYTIEKQYDSSTNTTTVSDPTYTKGSEEREVIVEEYGPWNNPGYFRNEEYERAKYTYYINDPDEIYENPEDYLDSRFQGEYSSNPTTESSKETPEDYGTYEGNKYIVTITEKNLEDSQPGKRPVKFALALITGLGGIAGIEMLIIKKQKGGTFRAIKKRLKIAREAKDIQDKVVISYQEKLDELKKDKEELSKKIEYRHKLTSRFEEKEQEPNKEYAKKQGS